MICCADVVCGIGPRRSGSGRVGRTGVSTLDPFISIAGQNGGVLDLRGMHAFHGVVELSYTFVWRYMAFFHLWLRIPV